jgi:protein-disulfide isomerase
MTKETNIVSRPFRILAASLLSATLLSAPTGVTLAATAPQPATPSVVVTDQTIRDWLATHPEAIDKILHDSMLRQTGLLFEMQQADGKRRQEEQMAKQAHAAEFIAQNKAALFDDPRDGRTGPSVAALSVVVFYDPECPICKMLQPTLARLAQEQPDIQIVYKDYPILGPMSQMASKAALAAAAQGKYAAFHDALMASKIAEHQLTEANVHDMAKAADLDLDRLKSDMNSPTVQTSLTATRGLAQSLGISGTPSLIIGNQVVVGNLPYEQILTFVQQAKAALPAGTVKSATSR